jgi:hypothetical protein
VPEIYEQCPNCQSTHLSHIWRADMARLRLIDEWACFTCGDRWTEITQYEDA